MLLLILCCFKPQGQRVSEPGLREVVYVDRSVLENVRSYWEGAQSCINCNGVFSRATDLADIKFVAQPLMATVDKRPVTIRKQMQSTKVASQPLGCAVSTNTMVTGLGHVLPGSFKGREDEAECFVCFETSSLEYAETFLLLVSQRKLVDSTVCVHGVPDLYERFSSWQFKSRPADKAYPWTVDCTFPSGFETLTCSGLSSLQGQPPEELQRVYVLTSFTLTQSPASNSYPLRISSRWPWAALRSPIDAMFTSADNGFRISPSKPLDIKLAYFQGPNFEVATESTRFSLRSSTTGPIYGGSHIRLISQLLHLIERSHNAVFFMGVPDGQVNSTLTHISQLLQASLNETLPSHGRFIEKIQSYARLNAPYLFVRPFSSSAERHLTLNHLMLAVNLEICIVPLPTPALAFEKLLISGQYAFSSYMAARYSAVFDVLVYFDGDAVPSLGPSAQGSLLDIFFETFFGREAHNCHGAQLTLVEWSIPTELSTPDSIVRCVEQFHERTRHNWTRGVQDCVQAYGNIAARGDSVQAMSVHYVDVNPEYLPQGVKYCPGFALHRDKIVELHLTKKKRPSECTCNPTA